MDEQFNFDNLRAKPYTYAKLHPIECLVVFGALILGCLLTFNPNAAETSPTLDAVPDAITVAWGLCFTVGGLLALHGILKDYKPTESGGLCMVSTAFAASLVPPFLDPNITRSPLLIIFASLAVGTGLRALGIVTRRIQ